MRRFFAYSSAVRLELPTKSEGMDEKLLLVLKKKLSEYSGEDADLTNNTVYFAVNLRSRFVGLDGGAITVEEKDGSLVVHYWLSYISPFLPFLVLDIFLFWLSSVVPSYEEASIFAKLIAGYLGFCVLSIIANVSSFSSIIYEAWHSVKK